MCGVRLLALFPSTGHMRSITIAEFILICFMHTEISNDFDLIGARGSVVVKALCYKPEGRGFDSR
jgi:hypothetical protein